MREVFLPLADVALIYDNSEIPALLIAEKRSGVGLIVNDAIRWRAIEEALG
jgi:predicted ABC-type ATPase